MIKSVAPTLILLKYQAKIDRLANLNIVIPHFLNRLYMHLIRDPFKTRKKDITKFGFEWKGQIGSSILRRVSNNRTDLFS